MKMKLKEKLKGTFAKAVVFTLGVSFTALIAAPLNVFITGETVSSQKMNDNFGKMSPVGTINAWHKSMTGSPSLPDGWVECNGQVLGDTESPYDGQMIPNLNGQARFLRGSSTSGTMQGDEFQGHFHTKYQTSGGWGGTITYSVGIGDQVGWRTLVTGNANPSNNGTNGLPRYGNETRPINMSVVWIMRTK